MIWKILKIIIAQRKKKYSGILIKLRRGRVTIVKERLDKGGNLAELEVQLQERDADGNIVQFDYLVNKTGRITIDRVLFDEDGIPQGGEQIAEYLNGSWQNS